MKKLLAIDANSILNRAFYGIRPLTTKEGIFTNAVYGFLKTVMNHIEALAPDYCAAAFDLRAPTFRHLKYDGYKAKRHAMPDELAMQLPYTKEILKYMGICVASCEGYEADDILGTCARLAQEADVFAYILTGDRDSLQLISPKVSVLLVKTADTSLYDTQKFVDTYGLSPEVFVDVKALMGDSSDNIPGVAGIGEKTALKLISEYGSLDALYEGIEKRDIGKSVKEKLISGRDDAYLSRELSEICRTVPCLTDIEQLRRGQTDRESLLSVLRKLEFGDFIKKLSLGVDCKPCEHTVFKAGAPPPFEGRLLSVAADKSTLYVYDGCDGYIFSSEHAELLKNNNIICDDSKRLYSDYPGINIVFDTYLAAYVLNSADSSYATDRLALSYLARSADTQERDDEHGVINAQTKRCEDIFALHKKLDELLNEHGCRELYMNVELPLSYVLAKMEKHGFRVDTDGLKKFGRELEQTISLLTDRIYLLAGGEFNLNSPKQLGEVLFERLGLPAQKKTKTGYSTNAESLEKLRPYHPIIEEILEYRNVFKLKSTYADGLIKVTDADGVIHSSFNQTVTATGRLSSTEPNLQNIPVRGELGRELRRYFIPKRENSTLIDADYSQIELRLLAAISGDETMIYAFENGIDIHTVTASQVFGVAPEDVTPELRKRAKAVNFGIVYGIGDYTLAQNIGVSRAAAAKYIQSYLHRYPAVERYLEDIKLQARRDGFVSTLLGRRRYIPELTSSKRSVQAFGERVAMNSPIQGTAADIIKLAMVNTQRALERGGYDAHLILQVHDELIIESDKSCADEVMKLLEDEMENALSLPVRLSVEITRADNWYLCK